MKELQPTFDLTNSYYQKIIGSRNTKSISVMILLFLGGISFFLLGIISYTNLLTKFNITSDLNYIPQGILLLFYGTCFLTLSIYITLTFWWDIGSGYNLFCNQKQILYIVRKNFPGRNQFLFFSYPYKLIKTIKFLKKEGINPRYNILIILKDKREIPLYPAQFLLKQSALEKEAITISNLLKVPLEIKQI